MLVSSTSPAPRSLASIFHYGKHTIAEAKAALRKAGIEVRG